MLGAILSSHSPLCPVAVLKHPYSLYSPVFAGDAGAHFKPSVTSTPGGSLSTIVIGTTRYSHSPSPNFLKGWTSSLHSESLNSPFSFTTAWTHSVRVAASPRLAARTVIVPSSHTDAGAQLKPVLLAGAE